MKLTLNIVATLWLATMLGTGIVYAQTTNAETDGNKNRSPYFVVLTDEGESAQLPLKSTSVTVNVAGVIADVNVKQVYSNSGKSTIEAVYVFPASTRSAVYDMEMKVNERVIKAVVEEKGKARNLYENAKKEGRTASLLEEDRPNVFKMNVANIVPGATVEVSLSYTELLVPTDNTYEFVYPTVVGPRYVGKGTTEATKQETWTANPYLTEGLLPISTFDLKLNITAGLPIKEIRCETHKNAITYVDKANAKLLTQEPNGGNRDFIAQYRLAGNAIESGVLLYKDTNGDQYFLAMMQPPQRVSPEMIPPREYVFILDVSGSMMGFPLEVSKEVMRKVMDGLKPNDLFNIVFFAGGSDAYSPQSLPATPANINTAMAAIDRKSGGGGTELIAALKTAMGLPTDNNYSRSFVILTDGFVDVEKETFDYIRNNLGNANFFSFGIGSSVNRYIIEGMAHVGYGEPFVATNPDEGTKQAALFTKYVSQPVLTSIDYTFENIKAYDVLPNKIPDLFASRPLIVTGKYVGNTEGALSIKGTSGSKPFAQKLTIGGNASNSLKALKYLWAREEIKRLGDYNNLRRNDSIKALIIGLGKQYNLLTEFTSFLAIDNQISNKAGQSATVKQPLPLPQGVSNNAVGGQPGASYTTIGTVDYDKGTDDMDVVCEFATSSNVVDDAPEGGFLIVEQMPEFPGGTTEMLKYLGQNLVYPVSAQENGIQGTVYLKITIDVNGKVSKVIVLRSLNKACDAEAIRLVMAMPTWKPGKQGGRAVPIEYTLPIRFALQ